jgi:hypothetical protein
VKPFPNKYFFDNFAKKLTTDTISGTGTTFISDNSTTDNMMICDIKSIDDATTVFSVDNFEVIDSTLPVSLWCLSIEMSSEQSLRRLVNDSKLHTLACGNRAYRYRSQVFSKIARKTFRSSVGGGDVGSFVGGN